MKTCTFACPKLGVVNHLYWATHDGRPDFFGDFSKRTRQLCSFAYCEHPDAVKAPLPPCRPGKFAMIVTPGAECVVAKHGQGELFDNDPHDMTREEA